MLDAKHLMLEKGMNVYVPSILTTGETLTDDMRETIEQAFAPGGVYNEYGGDGMQIAAECQYHDGMHINDESVFVEIVRDGERVPEGELGEIVLTNLEVTANLAACVETVLSTISKSKKTTPTSPTAS